MEKTKIQTIVLIILFAVICVVWFYPNHKSKSFDPVERKEKFEIPYNNDSGFVEDFFETQKNLEKKRPELLLLRDPFGPLPKGDEKDRLGTEGLALSGIAVDEAGRIAIVNNEIVREGDNIFGVKITKIMKDSITVEKEGKEYNLKLY